MTIRLVKPGDPVEVRQTEDGRKFLKLPEPMGKGEVKLPAPSSVANPIGLVVCYELFGLSDQQISQAVGFTQEQLETVRSTDVYLNIKTTVVDNIKDVTINEVTGVFRDNAKRAAGTIISNLDSNIASIAMTAATKVLDYAGISPKRIEAGDKMKGGLNIMFVDSPKLIEGGN